MTKHGRKQTHFFWDFFRETKYTMRKINHEKCAQMRENGGKTMFLGRF